MIKQIQNKNDKGRKKQIIQCIFEFLTNFSESAISAYSGQSAFFLMLSFLPFLLFFFSLLSWTPLTEGDFIQWAGSFIPESFSDAMKSFAGEVYTSGSGKLSLSMITAIFLSSKAFISLQLGLDDMYHVKENRNYIMRRVYSVLYSIVFALALVFLLGVVVFGNRIRNMIGKGILSGVHHIMGRVLDYRFVIWVLFLRQLHGWYFPNFFRCMLINTIIMPHFMAQ